jgi:hypothetical protein
MAKKSRKRRRKPRPKPATETAGTVPSVPAEQGSVQTAGTTGTVPKRRKEPDPDGAPPAPWGSFPLVEIAVLVGIVILVIGFLSDGPSQAILIGTGLVLCSVAGLELAIREHVAGYRSHTLVLSAVPAVTVLAVLFYLAPSGLAPAVRLTILFRNRSGGHSFRVKAPRRRR